MEESYEKKVEIVKERTGLSDDEARALLDSYNGDVIEALIQFERTKYNSQATETDSISQSDLIKYIKDLIKCGNVSKIIIRKDNEVLVNIPVNAGVVIGLVMLMQPVLLVLGAATAVFTKLEIDIIKCDGSVQVVNKAVKSTVESGTKYMSEVGQNLKDKFAVEYGKLKKKISQNSKK